MRINEERDRKLRDDTDSRVGCLKLGIKNSFNMI